MNKEYENIDPKLFKLAKFEATASEALVGESYNYWKSVRTLLFRNKGALIAISVIILIVILAIVAPIISPYAKFLENDARLPLNLLPSFSHPFGTNDVGDDMWTQVWYGARTSLMFATVVTILTLGIGVVVGSIWGYFRKTDFVFMELTRYLGILPFFLLVPLIILLSSGKPSFGTLVFAAIYDGWIAFAVLMRREILIGENREYNIASKTLGTPGYKIIKNNLLPHILPQIVQLIGITFPMAISLEASLALFGLGLGPDTLSLGRILIDNSWQWFYYPHILICPALVLGAITASFFLVSRVLADILDPKTHR